MVITHDGNRFIASTEYHERDVMKQAGFLWDPGMRKWWTKFPARAAALKQACDPRAMAAIQDHITVLESSRATAANIEIPCPEGLAYLPYQKAGIAYALDRDAVLFADEMGLGKTIQAIGYINARSKVIARVIVVCPTSLKLNWRRELQRWLVQSRSIDIIDSSTWSNPAAQVVVTNYERLVQNFKKISSMAWDLVIIDEAHYAKNPKAKRSIAVYNLLKTAKKKLLLTGTPLLNKPVELQPLAGCLSPDRFGDPLIQKGNRARWNFLMRYCDAHQEFRYGRSFWMFDGATNLDELQERLRASVMVRRLKADVLSELPPKQRTIVELEVENLVEPESVRRLLEEIQAIEAEMELATVEGDKASYALAAEKLKYANNVAFQDMSGYRHELAMKKLPSAIEYVRTMLESGVEKIVVFAHHRDVLEGLHAAFTDDGAVLVYGAQDPAARQAAVDAFQNDPKCRVFVGSVLAAGVGITLTAASHVVFAEVDWVPANITQAEDRCHRIGQRDVVFVYQLIVDETLDAYMVKKVVKKQEWADQALDVVPLWTELKIPAKPPVPTYNISQELRNAQLEVLRFLANRCDGARAEDGHGFNRLDTVFGKKLAAGKTLSDKQYHAAWKLCRKYRRQVPAKLRELLGYNAKTTEGKAA